MMISLSILGYNTMVMKGPILPAGQAAGARGGGPPDTCDVRHGE